ncbi:hypothetical protein HN446_01130 [bacterium]|jgi:hypothetical protein|nr:hypothetical protein [bacterium]
MSKKIFVLFISVLFVFSSFLPRLMAKEDSEYQKILKGVISELKDPDALRLTENTVFFSIPKGMTGKVSYMDFVPNKISPETQTKMPLESQPIKSTVIIPERNAGMWITLEDGHKVLKSSGLMIKNGTFYQIEKEKTFLWIWNYCPSGFKKSGDICYHETPTLFKAGKGTFNISTMGFLHYAMGQYRKQK